MTCTWGNAAGSVTVRSVNACGQSAALSKAVSLLTCMEEEGDSPSVKASNVFEIYPNPTTGVFVIRSLNPDEFEILNGMGQLLDKFSVGNNQTNVKELYLSTSGIYFIRAVSDGFIQRIVVVN
jgi:hypothetical protein